MRALLLLGLTGCAKLLGLEDTSLDQRDAAPDAPSVCDTPAVACTSSTGRSVCGGLFVATTGQLFTVAAPTGQACTSTEGPCGLTVYAQPLAEYLAGTPTGMIAGTIDDCGHYAIPDLDAAAADVAIVVQGTGVTPTARVLLDRDPAPGTDEDIDATVITTEILTAWAAALSITEAELATAYLVRYETATGDPSTMAVRVNGAEAVAVPPARPWARYFSGTLTAPDPAATTGPAALVGPPAGTFRLGGFRTGKTCGRDGFRPVTAIVDVTLTDC